jgi:DtxR family transcriptional regulator, Mn-dependent transcriptional regulator
MAGASLSAVMEDYLKAIYELGGVQAGEMVPAAALVERMAAPPATVTDTVKRLAALGLVLHAPYRGVTLTAAGEKAALEVIRHHRLLEQYLVEALGLSWDEVHAEADRLEHVLSEALEARIAAALGHPTSDPHGDPIPAADLTMPSPRQDRLSEQPAGASVVVARVGDQEPAKLRYLAELGLVPGAMVDVLTRLPFDGPLHLRIGAREETIGFDLAATIFIQAAPGAGA